MMPTTIFLSYRRMDALVEARALYERLRAEFGHEAVFIDLEGVDYGVDFEDVLQEQLKHCQVLLALIGKDWAGEKPRTSQRRIDDENDFVRIEIRVALSREILVIPLLINGAEMPHLTELPDDLKSLSRRQGLPFDFGRFDADVGRLVAALRRHISKPDPTIRSHAADSSIPPSTSTPFIEESYKAKTTGIRGQHVANVNTLVQGGFALRDAIASQLPAATNIHVIQAATINFGTGPDSTRKFQYQVTFIHDRTILAEEFQTIMRPLISGLNTYATPSAA